MSTLPPYPVVDPWNMEKTMFRKGQALGQNHFESLPAELQLQIMFDLDDLETLHRLLTAFPSVSDISIQSFNTLMPRLLRRSLEPWGYRQSRFRQKLRRPPREEFQHCIYAIVSARTACPSVKGKEALVQFLTSHFTNFDGGPPPHNVPRSRASLDYIVEVLNATKFFAWYLLFRWREGRTKPDYAGFQYQELGSKLFRALLNFQLFCELFHQPGDSLDSISDWEQRFPEQQLYWTRLATWEVEECKCVYHSLAFDVEVCTANEGSFLMQRRVEDDHCDALQYRGLPYLRNFLMGKPMTRFGLSYIRRFLQKALSGFSVVDPQDRNHFSRSSRAIWSSNAARGKRFPFAPKSTDVERLDDLSGRWRKHDTEYDAMAYLRRLGWCFWNLDVLYDWKVLDNPADYDS
ncbi:hypothetical protein PRK78_000650 [Emydomyces testavorans]|uniref:Uncharacterized protein n=1 Tax=Emydomyces testavorans TaxID=2070801 RepID=A0AAF0DCB8_9EURO|nr:hypothetical protein PRK78_000650 [Emydomyces testavorans]